MVGWQWPDGGWNCDKRALARPSSVQETLLPLRGLARHLGAGRATPGLREAVDRAAEFLLQRRLLWRCHDGAPIRPAWGPHPLSIQWPIRFYDVLSALVVMTELGRVADPRCTDALHHLAGRGLRSGGFPVEVRTARTVDVVTNPGTFADWDRPGAPEPTRTSPSTPPGCSAPDSARRGDPRLVLTRHGWFVGEGTPCTLARSR